MALTPKQQLFAQEYLVDRNARQAAIRAGYSERTARAIGHENLTKPDIAAAIDAASKEREKRVHITQDMVLSGLYAEAIREGEGSSHSARVSAWEKLAKHLGLLTDKTELSGPDGGPITEAIQVEFIDSGKGSDS